MNDDACETSGPGLEFCSICNFSRMPELNLRGLCSSLDVDTFFTMITSSMKNRRYHLQGWTHSKIEWESNEREWQITSVKQPGVIATCNDTNDYPLGTHVWYFEDQLCSEPGKSFRLLNLQGCSEGQVSCRNGDCVPIDSRFVSKMTSPYVKTNSKV